MRGLLLLLFCAGPAVALDVTEWQPHPGAALPGTGVFRDEAGREVTLRAALGEGVPVVLDLGYFHCTSLCGLVRADLVSALAASGLVAGQDYRLVVMSIDPADTPADAGVAKAADLREAGVANDDAWRYLTGPAPAVAAVADAVGFQFRYDPEAKQFTHPAGLVVLTGDGRVGSYLGGVGYTGARLRRAVEEAGQGGIEPASFPVRLLCHFDVVTGRYTLALTKVLRWMAVLTVLTLGGTLWALHRTGPRRP